MELHIALPMDAHHTITNGERDPTSVVRQPEGRGAAEVFLEGFPEDFSEDLFGGDAFTPTVAERGCAPSPGILSLEGLLKEASPA